jgi:tetratricopeptide (TPR) repeat protein
MQAISTALNHVLEAGSWFVRAHEVRLWIVRVSSDLRKTALQVVTGLEFLQDNRSAWVVIPDAYTTPDPGWQVRANRLIAHWSDRRKAFLEKEGIEMPEAKVDQTRVPDPSWFRKSLPISPMRDACAAVITALRPPLDGFVIVLTPAIITNLKGMGSEIEALVNDSALAACRWVWVLDAENPWPDVLDRLGDRGLRCQCIPDPDQQKKDFAAMLAAPPTMIGRAGPRGITPPRRINEPPPMPPEERAAALRAAGVNPEYCEKAPELQRLILGAAVAMKNGEHAEAVRQQQAAVDLAFALELFDVTVLCRVALSSYLTALGRRDEALRVLQSAAKLAREHGFALQEAQAHLGIGLLLALAKRYEDSADAYGVSARCAEAANVRVLAIEAWRMAGQVSLQAPNREKAWQSFCEAIRVAEASEVEAVKDSTASEAARKLAEICDQLGMPDQANSLRAEAEAMERGEIGINNPVVAEV